LYYYACLLAAAGNADKRKGPLPAETVRQVIAIATYAIIKDEFLAEFAPVIANIGDVIRAFRHRTQILDWGQIKVILDSIRFETIGGLRCDTLESKVEVLYAIGFLGIILDKPMSEKLASFRHAFSFHEQQLLTEKIARDDYEGLQYAIHPVFCEYLQLDTSGNIELILAMTWEDLHRNETLRGIRP
jgi:hypothetical protein